MASKSDGVIIGHRYLLDWMCCIITHLSLSSRDDIYCFLGGCNTGILKIMCFVVFSTMSVEGCSLIAVGPVSGIACLAFITGILVRK